eukprot:bmy_06701T0
MTCYSPQDSQEPAAEGSPAGGVDAWPKKTEKDPVAKVASGPGKERLKAGASGFLGGRGENILGISVKRPIPQGLVLRPRAAQPGRAELSLATGRPNAACAQPALASAGPRSPARKKAQAAPPSQPPPPPPVLSEELLWGHLTLNKCLVLASLVALLGSAFQLCRGEPAPPHVVTPSQKRGQPRGRVCAIPL